jgi:hypothetical protein
MGKIAKKTTTASAVVKKVAKSVDFAPPKGEEVTPAMIWAFIDKHAKGQLNNVIVAPLDNCRLQDAKRTPFGYNIPGGVRATYHDFHLVGLVPFRGVVYGKKGDARLGEILAAMRKIDGHSKKTMVCTVALLNGGYNPARPTWGTPFITLTAVAAD